MEEANAGCSREEGFFSQFSTMISQRCPEFQRQWVPSGATEGGRELILSVSLHSPASLHYIISKRPCVPSYHLRQDCTRTLGVQLPLRTLSPSFSLLFSFSLYLGLSSSLLLLFPGPTFTSSFNARTSCILPRVPFSSLTTIFTFARRKRDRWMNRRRAQGSETSRRRTPATGFGGQTGDRESRESRPTIHFYPVLLFSPRCWIWRESKHSRFGRAVNYPGKRRKLKANRRNVR